MTVISRMEYIRGWAGKRGWEGGGDGWEAEGGLMVPLGVIQQQCVSSK